MRQSILHFAWTTVMSELMSLYKNLVFTGSDVYEKVYDVLTKKPLMNGLNQASPLPQTSCIEGFHSVVNQFAPKMICYSFPGMYCRYLDICYFFTNNTETFQLWFQQYRAKANGGPGAERPQETICWKICFLLRIFVI